MTSPNECPIPTNIHHQEVVMGTVITIDAYGQEGISQRQFAPHLREALATLHREDKLFSTWDLQSPMSQLRRGEISLGEAPAIVAEVLALCRTARKLSGGWFDPWALAGGVDPTGYVKGWAAQRAVNDFIGAGLDGAMVNAAGDIASIGGPSLNENFRVGIVQPSEPSQLACVVELHSAIATSGTYERGQHLVNPFTGEHRAVVASASVTGADLGLADALATALAVGGPPVLQLIEQLTGYEGFTIGFDATQQSTPGFPFVALRSTNC